MVPARGCEGERPVVGRHVAKVREHEEERQQRRGEDEARRSVHRISLVRRPPRKKKRDRPSPGKSRALPTPEFLIRSSECVASSGRKGVPHGLQVERRRTINESLCASNRESIVRPVGTSIPYAYDVLPASECGDGKCGPHFRDVPNVTFHTIKYPTYYSHHGTFWRMQLPMMWADDYTTAKHILVLDVDTPLVMPMHCHHLFDTDERPQSVQTRCAIARVWS